MLDWLFPCDGCVPPGEPPDFDDDDAGSADDFYNLRNGYASLLLGIKGITIVYGSQVGKR